MKKIIYLTVMLLVVAAGILFALKGADSYDASKYSLKLNNSLSKGATIEYTLPDQFDNSVTLDDTTQKIIFVFTKEGGHIVKEFLAVQPKEYLRSRHAAFVADISAMPVVIRNTFAMPDLKKQNYTVVLVHDKQLSDMLKKDINSQEIVVATLNNKKIENIEYVKNAKELEAKLK